MFKWRNLYRFSQQGFENLTMSSPPFTSEELTMGGGGTKKQQRQNFLQLVAGCKGGYFG